MQITATQMIVHYYINCISIWNGKRLIKGYHLKIFHMQEIASCIASYLYLFWGAIGNIIQNKDVVTKQISSWTSCKFNCTCQMYDAITIDNVRHFIMR